MAEKVAILNSRQSLRPCGDTAWVKSTIEAARWIKKEKGILISSIGNQTWELVTTLAATLSVPCRLVLPLEKHELTEQLKNKIITQFGLHKELVQFEAIKNSNSASLMNERDNLIANLSQILLPISISSSGTMQQLIQSHSSKLNNKFKAKYNSKKSSLAYIIEQEQLSDSVHEFELEKQKYLIHWTRTCNSCWPSEKKHEFYNDIIKSESYPRSASKTLHRILNSGMIISFGRHMPQNKKTVSFSGLPPSDAIRLMKWRARYHEMSFEPYGVGIKIETAKQIGIIPVRYYDLPGKPDATIPNWLQQSSGKISDWTQENEYRHSGDLNLHEIDKSDLILFTRYESDALELSKQTGLRAIPIERP